MSGSELSVRYPALFAKIFWEWGPISAQFRASSHPPPLTQLAKVRLVPFIGDDVVIIRMTDGNWDHPGGTMEPGESHEAALAREAMEEAGALVSNFNIFGVFDCISHNPEPYRSHYPHPEFSQIIGIGDVELVTSPNTVKSDELEAITSVEVVTVNEAVRRLSMRTDGSWQADMHQGAADIRSGEITAKVLDTMG